MNGPTCGGDAAPEFWKKDEVNDDSVSVAQSFSGLRRRSLQVALPLRPDVRKVTDSGKGSCEVATSSRARTSGTEGRCGGWSPFESAIVATTDWVRSDVGLKEEHMGCRRRACRRRRDERRVEGGPERGTCKSVEKRKEAQHQLFNSQLSRGAEHQR
jgi:hypothetical protein